MFITVSVITLFNNYFQINNYNLAFLRTNKGNITTAKINNKQFKFLINYLSKNVKKDGKIWAIPEGHIINYLTDRQSVKYYDNLMPITVETHGELNILDFIQHNSPEYIIFTPRETIEFNYKGICQDYALNICNYIKNNYQIINFKLEDFVLYKKSK